ncbi:MAG: UDP-glucose 4-epimerase [Boseongicola sp. SB0677_bin_26]|nr:UDP-glucose 4-epimerase [Boseongicola sp. SB0677_bin_26]
MTGRNDPAVLVSGGAGYVGSHVVLALLEAGYRAVVLDDLSRGHRAAVPAGVELAVADAGNRRAVEALIVRRGIAAAIHCADASGVDEPAVRIRKGAAAGAAFAEACAAGGVRRLVLTSSAAGHGAGAEPASAYGAAKRATEARTGAAFAGSGRSHAVLRCFNVAGADPALRAGSRRGRGLVQAACEAALGLRQGITVFGVDWETADGTCVRDWVHVCDVAAAHVAALRALERGADGLVADVGTGHGHSVREVLAAVERASGSRLAVRVGPRRPGDVACSVAAPERIGRLPGWRARSGSLEAAVLSALAWTEALAREDGRRFGARVAGVAGS